MSKIIRTTDSDYRIITAQAGQIILDTTNATNDRSGTVIIRGDLEINGGSTTIESEISTVVDNILLLSSGNTGVGLPVSLDRPRSSGIEVERGSLANARWVYDDSVSWDLGGATGIGAWLGTQGTIGAEIDIPIKTTGIIPNSSLYINTGNGIISVTGTNNYEQSVLYYDSGVITPDPSSFAVVRDDDTIPNAKAVKDLIDYSLATIVIDKIIEDDSKIEVIDKNNIIFAILETGVKTTFQTKSSHGYTINDAITISGVTTSPTDTFINTLNGTWIVTDVPSANTIEVTVNTTGGNIANYVTDSGLAGTGLSVNEPRIEVTVEGTKVTSFYNNRVVLSDIEIRGTEIFTAGSNEDLILSANGGGVVRIKDTLELTKTPGDDDNVNDPAAPLDGTRLYSKTLSTGKTGLFFINENNYKDEIISKNRALLYSMLF
tara:strand:+ start:217 stop:1515 length:1299 start_codon:yes stop_codon:yes gene_type:complete